MAGVSAIYHFEELRAIIGRMDAVLPPSHPERVGWISHSQVKGQKLDPVIESNAVATQFLNLGGDKKWQFRNKGGKVLEGQGVQRALVQKETSHQTAMGMEKADAGALFPAGVSLWHSSDHARRIIPMVRHDLKEIFESVKKSSSWGIPYDSSRRGLFSMPGGSRLCFHGCMHLIREHAPYLHRFCLEGAVLAAHMYGLNLSEFGMVSKLVIHQHDPREGVPMNLLESSHARYDGGPVLLICLGIPVSSHDMAPALSSPDNSAEPPVRIVVPEGVMMVIDGDARFRYAHGFPRGQTGAGEYYYCITIYMDCIQQTSIMGYERETRTLIMTTPMVREHIISTRPELRSRTNVHGTLQRDTLWRLVQQMRTRLRMAESFSMVHQRVKEEVSAETPRISPG